MDNEENKEVFVDEGIKSGLVVSDLGENVKEGFLSYAMSVIVSRALPDARDGFKPVQRRIIYAMNEDGYTSDKPHVKSAKITGNVMGKYHPHGDSSIYEALVRMAQDFSMRNVLIDGHGNFGNLDGDGAAAARYTEARLSKLAGSMVRDINENTVDFVDNYDGTEKEPTVLPCRFPNLLVNGCSGIAVGMATEIPTHNLGEVCDAIREYSHNPEISVEELMNFIKGPDFPTGGIILGRSGIRKLYETGRGKIVVRGIANIEENDAGRTEIIISEIPYNVNKSELVRKIGELADNKIIDGITDVKDETSYKTGIRIIVELSKEAVPEVVLNQLYKNTPLQSAFNGNIVALVNGAPQTLTLKDMLREYIEFQVEIITRRTKFRLNKAENRNHILDGLIIASDDIENVVHLIKISEDPAQALKDKYNLDDPQVDAILSMTLRKLSRIEGNKLLEERAAIEANIKEYNRILESRENIIEVVLAELKEIRDKYSDVRRTKISGEEVDDIDDEDLIKQEDCIVTLTNGGYIKRMSLDEFRAQNRGGKGHKGITTHSDDVVEKVVQINTHVDILFFTSFGKVYRLRGYKIPEGTRVSKGLPITNVLDLAENEKVMSILPIEEYDEKHYLWFATKLGVVKRTLLSEFALIRQNGKNAISLREGDELLAVKETTGEDIVCIASDNGKMVGFKETDVRCMGRNATGVKGITLNEGDKALSIGTSSEGKYVFVLSEKGYGKMSPVEQYRLTKRGARGVITLNSKDKNGRLAAMRIVNGDEDLVVFTKSGIVIRVHLNQVNISSRNTIGVKIINVGDKEVVSTVAVVPFQEDENEVLNDEESKNCDNNQTTGEDTKEDF
jgi:DNA gyrase subunit A